jgi:hypothetical protein
MLCVPLRRVRAGEIRCEEFLYELKAGPAGGLRPPSGPATTRRSPGNRPHPPPGWNDTHQAVWPDKAEGGPVSNHAFGLAADDDERANASGPAETRQRPATAGLQDSTKRNV